MTPSESAAALNQLGLNAESHVDTNSVPSSQEVRARLNRNTETESLAEGHVDLLGTTQSRQATEIKSLPSHISSLLTKYLLYPCPSQFYPSKQLLIRHPLHRDVIEMHVAALASSMQSLGFLQEKTLVAPMVVLKYSQTRTLHTTVTSQTKTVVHHIWNNMPVYYIIAGGARFEAINHLMRYDLESFNVLSENLKFHIINGDEISPWETFLLAISLNTIDHDSRPSNYFERTDQLAIVASEISQRKQDDATCRDLAVEICFNPYLVGLREAFSLSPDSIPLHALDKTNLLPATQLVLLKSRDLFRCLPSNTGVILNQIPDSTVEVLDVLIDMATCVNSDRMRFFSSSSEEDKHKKKASTRTEGFLHAVAEDQLRVLFRDIVTINSAATFDILMLRDLVSIVFGAIQECSRQFRKFMTKKNEPRLNEELTSQEKSATSKSAAAYWVERIVQETSAGGLLAGMWNFPAAALVTLFYVYFVNEHRSFEKHQIQENLLKSGTILYRCIAELALVLRVSGISMMSSSIPVQIRILESAAMLFRFSLFGSVTVEMFPSHPYSIPVEMLCVGNPQKSRSLYPVESFTNADILYRFVYSHWLKNLIVPNPHQLLQTVPMQHPQPKPHDSDNRSGMQNPNQANHMWAESRRSSVAATATRLKQEVEVFLLQENDNPRIRLKRSTQKSTSNAEETTSVSVPSIELVDIEILDPSILPMAQAARSEFVTLIHGVITMLIERCHLSEVNSSNTDASKSVASTPTNLVDVRILTVPANMVVLAAIKVALSFISPHFDILAPCSTHWVTTRARLILWIWKTSKDELTRKAGDLWSDCWRKDHNGQVPPLRLSFLTTQRNDKQGAVELTESKLGEVILLILPDVLASMIAFYEEKGAKHISLSSDELIMRQFFARWLKSASDSDLISKINTVLSSPSSMAELQYSEQKSTPSLMDYDHLGSHHPCRRARQVSSSADAVAAQNLHVDALSHAVGHSPKLMLGTFLARAPSVPADVSTRQIAVLPHSTRSVMASDSLPARKARRAGSGRAGTTADDDYNEWLQTIPHADRFRLEHQKVPECDVSALAALPFPEILQWKPSEPSNHSQVDYSVYDSKRFLHDWNEYVRVKRAFNDAQSCTRLNKSATEHRSIPPPLSSFDWKILISVLRLLKSRGVDTLASREFGQVFFLDLFRGSSQVNDVESKQKCAPGFDNAQIGTHEIDPDLYLDETLRSSRRKSSSRNRTAAYLDGSFSKKSRVQFLRYAPRLNDDGLPHQIRIHDAESLQSFLDYGRIGL